MAYLFQHDDFLLRAHFLQHFRPYRDAHLAEVGFAQQEHQGARLAYSAADGERQLVVNDALVIGKFEIVEQLRHLKLAAEGFGVPPDTHRAEFVTALRATVPDQYVAVTSES